MRPRKLEMENLQSYHFVFVGFADFKKVFRDLTENLPYYRFASQGKSIEKEIFYDVPDELLSSAGLILSKWYNNGNIYFHIRRLSPNFTGNKKLSKKFLFGSCEEEDEPKDFSLQIASAIEHSFTSPFSVDLDSIVKQTAPKIETVIEADRYQIICGTGYRATLEYENVTYKDVKTGKKVSRLGMTFKFPLEECEETEEILRVIDRKVKGLASFELSRFEIAEKLLYSENDGEFELAVSDDEEEDEE